nr:Heme-regulated two-component response regulator [Raoultella sp. NCTC 9187]
MKAKKYIAVIFKEWLPLHDSLTPEVKAVLNNIAAEQAEALAARFYDFIFQDPDIARHLTYDLVQERLEPIAGRLGQRHFDLPRRTACRRWRNGNTILAAFTRGSAFLPRPCCAVPGSSRPGLSKYIRDSAIDRQTGVAAIYYAIMGV